MSGSYGYLEDFGKSSLQDFLFSSSANRNAVPPPSLQATQMPSELQSRFARLQIQNEELRSIQNELTAELLTAQEENSRLSKEMEKIRANSTSRQLEEIRQERARVVQMEQELFAAREKMAISEELLSDMTAQRDKAFADLAQTKARLSRVLSNRTAGLKEELSQIKRAVTQMRTAQSKTIGQCLSALEKGHHPATAVAMFRQAVAPSPILPASPPDSFSVSSMDFTDRMAAGGGGGDQTLRSLLQYAKAQIRDLSSENAALSQELRGLSLTNASLQSAFHDLAEDTAKAFVDMKARLASCENAALDAQQLNIPTRRSQNSSVADGYDPSGSLAKLNFTSLLKSRMLAAINTGEFSSVGPRSGFSTPTASTSELFSTQLELSKALREVESLRMQLSERDASVLTRQMDATAQAEALRAENEAIRRKARSEVEGALDDATRKVAEATKAHSAQIADLTQELSQLRSARALQDRTIEGLQADLVKAKNALEESEAAVERLSRRLRDMAGESGDAERAAREAKEAQQKREAETEAVRGRFVKEMQEQRDKYLKQLEDQKERFMRMLKEEREEHEVERARLEKEAKMLRDHVPGGALAGQPKAQSDENRSESEEDTRQALALAKSQLSEAQGQVASLREEITDLFGMLESAGTRQREAAALYREERVKSQKEMEAMQSVNRQLMKACDECIVAKDRLAVEVESLHVEQQAIGQLASKNRELEERLAAETAQVHANQSEARSLKVTLASAEDILRSLRSTAHATTQSLTDAVSRIERKDPALWGPLFASVPRADLSAVIAPPNAPSPTDSLDLLRKAVLLKDLTELVNVFAREYEQQPSQGEAAEAEELLSRCVVLQDRLRAVESEKREMQESMQQILETDLQRLEMEFEGRLMDISKAQKSLLADCEEVATSVARAQQAQASHEQELEIMKEEGLELHTKVESLLPSLAETSISSPAADTQGAEPLPSSSSFTTEGFSKTVRRRESPSSLTFSTASAFQPIDKHGISGDESWASPDVPKKPVVVAPTVHGSIVEGNRTSPQTSSPLAARAKASLTKKLTAPSASQWK